VLIKASLQAAEPTGSTNKSSSQSLEYKIEFTLP
jgi:hypothetical protein